jgi:hypothetical protein
LKLQERMATLVVAVANEATAAQTVSPELKARIESLTKSVLPSDFLLDLLVDGKIVGLSKICIKAWRRSYHGEP